MKKAVERKSHLSGMITFYGRSGLGKSTAAAYVANKYRAFYVECLDAWSRKALLVNLCRVMGLVPAKNDA